MMKISLLHLCGFAGESKFSPAKPQRKAKYAERSKFLSLLATAVI